MNNTHSRIQAGHNGNWSSIIYNAGDMRNSWHYSAVTFNNTDGFELYYNGTSVASNTTATTIPIGNGLIRIGAYSHSADPPGNFFDGYIPVGTCTNTSSFEITINPLDSADFNYDSPTYCVGGTDPTPTITGLSGGVFSSTASISIDTASGTIDLSAPRQVVIPLLIPLQEPALIQVVLI
jgi:hypothetical protein